MYVEQRIYSLVPGSVAEYLRIYDELGRDVQERILGTALGCFTREFGEMNQLIFLWPFASLDERAQRRTVLLYDPEFKRFRDATRHLLLKQENTMLTRVPRPSAT